MTKARFLALSTTVLLAITLGPRSLEAEPSSSSAVSVDKRFIAANTQFAIRLFKDAAGTRLGQNVLISPCGVSMILSLTYDGARGDTQKAIGQVLCLGETSSEKVNESNSALTAALKNPGVGVQLDIANAVWANDAAPIVPSFVETAKKSYQAEAATLRLADAGPVIDDWVRRRTHGRIDKIAEGLNKRPVLCLTNTVYFKGPWTTRFDKRMTSDGLFTCADGKAKSVPMMWQESSFRYYSGDGFAAAALPYGDERMSMYIFVPSTASNIQAFLTSLNADNWEKWMSEFHETLIVMKAPRWKCESHTDLRTSCTNLGMGIAFDPNQADLRGMCSCGSNNNVFIDVLKQTVFMEVNEDGTEAAAGTFESMIPMCIVPELTADRPFFYAIRDDATGEVLFMGTVADPTLTDRAK